MVLSCNKPEDVTLPNEGSVYMPQASGSRGIINLQLSPNAQEVAFGAAYGGLKYSGQDINVNFKLDTGLVAAYNARNGTNYQVLPDSVYVLSGLNSVIAAKSTSSNPLVLNVSSSKMRFGVRYMLPVSLTASSSGAINPALQTTYFRFDTILRKSVDITGQGTLTVSNENPSGATAEEGSLKLTDNNTSSKFLYFGFNPAGWFQLQFAAPVNIGAYTLTSANDAPGRDPKSWTLQGSKDGNTWTVLDTRVDEFFSARNQTRRFELPATMTGLYTHYRIFLTANNGESLFQLSEWRLIRYE
ncbi:hypothetical protein BUE76_22585 [Cnuella takakiae]|nr:hypothetical protein BUE76_22585 [Cnuella takakiae]